MHRTPNQRGDFPVVAPHNVKLRTEVRQAEGRMTSKHPTDVRDPEPKVSFVVEPAQDGGPMHRTALRCLRAIPATVSVFVAAYLLLAGSSPLPAGTGPATPQVPVEHSVSVPAQLHNPEWVREKVLGTVNERAVGKHADFDSYYSSRMKSARGYALEAESTITVNSRMRATGKPIRWIPSATINGRHSTIDIYEVDIATGKVLRRIQAKAGANAAWQALTDAKYENMHILTTQESYRQLERELKRVEARGKPLNSKYAALKKAIQTGRLMRRLPCGAPLPEASHLDNVARAYLQKHWKLALRVRAGASARPATARAAATATKAPTSNAAKAPGRSPTQTGARKPAGSVKARTVSVPKSRVRTPTPSTTLTKSAVRRTRIWQQVGKQATRVTKAAPMVVLTVEATRVGYHAYRGDMRSATKAASGAAGGIAGAKAGAVAGATIGSVAGPAGALIGGAVGAVVGGVGGAVAAEKVGEKIYDWVTSWW